MGGVERAGDVLRVRPRATDGGMDLAIEADEVIAATGFVAPLRALPALGVATFGPSRLPAQTPYWESASLAGIYFAGTINMGSPGLKKNGVAGTGAGPGTRFNARILAREIAERHFGVVAPRPALAPRDVVGYLLEEATDAPELWNQKGYLARAVLFGVDGPYDEGIVPLQAFVDGSGPDGVAIGLEGGPWGGRRCPASATATTGRARSPASGIPRRASCCWGSRPGRTAATAPGACSPATARATSSMRRCTPSGSPAGRRHAIATTACG